MDMNENKFNFESAIEHARDLIGMRWRIGNMFIALMLMDVTFINVTAAVLDARGFDRLVTLAIVVVALGFGVWVLWQFSESMDATNTAENLAEEIALKLCYTSEDSENLLECFKCWNGSKTGQGILSLGAIGCLLILLEHAVIFLGGLSTDTTAWAMGGCLVAYGIAAVAGAILWARWSGRLKGFTLAHKDGIRGSDGVVYSLRKDKKTVEKSEPTESIE